MVEVLTNRGWFDGRDVRIEGRYAAGDASRFETIAREVVALAPDVIFVQSTGFVAAVHKKTSSIPVVFSNVSDPVGAGFAASLARPGKNLTGLTLFDRDIPGKWLGMLKEIAPQLTRAGVLINPSNSPFDYFVQPIARAAASFGIEVVPIRIESVETIDKELRTFAREPQSGLVVVPGSTMLTHREVIITLAASLRLPAVYPERVYATDGGLLSYSIADHLEPFRQAATYIDRILRGEKPADLPVQGPTKYVTVVNAKTAKALGVTVPASLLVAADEVIE
jgi:putative tryptophan/tyrosine transport system substrate-binding protein